ncbi:SLC13 family permease [Abyssisolibacter fermentans]|uniref:SLC13 family permease n=1 Tax=Abyssisolibacter fermentans TaxID=1766203 RepID=UPI00082C175D|nr:SLC13 family permease [Abyssisolibacter fermentans]
MQGIIKKPKTLIFTILFAIFSIAFLPFETNMKFATVICFVALILWGLNAVNNSVIACAFLLSCLVFNLAPSSIVFRFPMTENFYLIILSYLISYVVTSTGTAKVFSRKIMNKMATTPVRLVLFSYVAGFLLIFFIPQPFPRVILLTAFYKEFLSKQDISNTSKSILFFSIFTASTFTSMFFINADTLLNYVVVKLAGANINWEQWAIYMSIPTIVCCIVTFFLFLIIFKKELFINSFSTANIKISQPLSKQQKKALIVCFIILIGFATQSIHNLNAVFILGIGVVISVMLKLIRIDSIKSINWSLLLFFTAAFSVGGVLNHCGFAKMLADWLITLMPESNGNLAIIFLTLITLILNFLLGSAVTTSSVVIPTISHIGIFATQNTLCLFVYTIVSVQYVLPFHHATIMVGYSEGLYDTKTIAKYGIFLTLFTFILILFVCIPWWNLVMR